MTRPPATRILAAIDDSPAAAPVLAAATAFAARLGGTIDLVHVDEPGKHTAAAVAEHVGLDLRVVDGDPAAAILAAAADPAVAVVAMGARGHQGGALPVGHVTCAVLEQIDKPVLVVPPDAPTPDDTRPIQRVLFPFEGTVRSTGAVTATLHRLADAGVDLVGVHVFTADTVPAFWDQQAHAERSWADEFITRWCAGSDIDLHLRRGAPAETIVEVADTEKVDIIALGWSQDMSPGRAAVVRAALTGCRHPVLLIPTGRTDP